MLFRGVFLLVILSARKGPHGFTESMVLFGWACMYYLYFRGNNPFVKFEDSADGVNLHYRAEETKIALVLFLLVVAAIGAKDRDMAEVCGWIFTVMVACVVVLVFKNFVTGVRNTNYGGPPEDTLKKKAPKKKKGKKGEETDKEKELELNEVGVTPTEQDQVPTPQANSRQGTPLAGRKPPSRQTTPQRQNQEEAISQLEAAPSTGSSPVARSAASSTRASPAPSASNTPTRAGSRPTSAPNSPGTNV